MRPKKNDNFLIGMVIGALVPVIGYFGIQIIFETLTTSGVMDEVTHSTFGKRMKTLCLLAICCNIIPSQLSSNKRYTNILRGIVFATLLYTACWALYFYLGVRI